MFSRSVTLLDDFPAGCNSFLLFSSAVWHDAWQDPFTSVAYWCQGPAPLLQGASICLGGSWWWFFCTRKHSGCDLYYCLYSLLLKDHLREPSCVQDFSQEYGSLCWPCINLSWQIANGALRTGYCLVISFGMVYIPIACFCSPSVIETFAH